MLTNFQILINISRFFWFQLRSLQSMHIYICFTRITFECKGGLRRLYYFGEKWLILLLVLYTFHPNSCWILSIVLLTYDTSTSMSLFTESRFCDYFCMVIWWLAFCDLLMKFKWECESSNGQISRMSPNKLSSLVMQLYSISSAGIVPVCFNNWRNVTRCKLVWRNQTACLW